MPLGSVGYLECRAVLGTRAAMIIDPRGGDVGVAQLRVVLDGVRSIARQITSPPAWQQSHFRSEIGSAVLR
jgi:hypothetical protein